MEPQFDVVCSDDAQLGSRLLIGTANPGMVGLTTVDYLATHGETEQVGHVRPEGVPSVTPFSEGTPRRPIRLYAAPGLDATLLVSELAVAPVVADQFVDALVAFADSAGIEEITAINAIPFPHGPEQHDAFLVATDRYRTRHEAAIGTALTPLQNGFFDGVAGAVAARGLDADGPAVGVLVTPAHPPGPDFDGSVLMIEAIEALYEASIDDSELRERSEQMRQYYQRLAEQMDQLNDGQFGSSEFGTDGMYM